MVVKRCDYKGCKKIIREHNKSGLCHHHLILKHGKTPEAISQRKEYDRLRRPKRKSSAVQNASLEVKNG